MTEIELNILDAIQKMRCGFLDAFFSFITTLGNAGIIWIVIALIMLLFKKTRKCGIVMAIALILGLLIGNVALKNIIGRDRPFEYDPNALKNIIISLPTDRSFPSGHTLASIESAVVILFYNKKFGLAALVLAVLISFSRLYLYVHFPSDILGGIILGIGIAFLSNIIYKKFISGKKIGKIEL